jgi:5-methylthioadenosine/S-adenosylhomocysteine deaminase
MNVVARMLIRGLNFVLLSAIFQTTCFAISAKLVIKNAQIFTMAAGQRKPINGYLVIAHDGTIMKIASGNPPAGISAKKFLDARGDWIIPGFISAHSHL